MENMASGMSYGELLSLYEKAVSDNEGLRSENSSLKCRNGDLERAKATLEKDNEALKKDNEALKKDKESLETAKKDLESALAGVISELGDERAIIKKYNLERFCSKRDSAYRDAAKAASAKPMGAKAKKGGKGGRKKGSKSFGGVDLEALSAGNDPVVADAALSLPEGERASLVRIGEDKSYVIELQRAKAIVRKVIRPLYRDAAGKMVQSPSPAPISGSYAGASLLADAQTTKYCLGVPAYRYSGWLSMGGIPVSEQLLTKWIVGAGEAERPVYEAISSSLASAGAKSANVDETPIEMLSEASPKSGRLGKRGYMFALSADGAKAKLRLYSFSKSRETTPVDAWVSGWDGAIVVDGYAGYDRFAEGDGKREVQRCLAHARRKWADIAKVGGKGADEKVRLFDAVFESEAEIAKASKGPDDTLRLRQGERGKKVAEDLKEGMRKALGEATKGSPEWKAANYFVSMEDGMMAFMSDGSIKCDNNAAERCCKKVVMARRNFLFVQSKAGGEAAAIALTLIETAIANGVEPRGYLEWILSDTRAAAKSPADFLPWSDKVPEALKMKKKK